MNLKQVVMLWRKAFLCVLSYRMPLQVNTVVQHLSSVYCYPLCPRCNCSLERDYMAYCDRCGQRLGWKFINIAQVRRAPLE